MSVSLDGASAPSLDGSIWEEPYYDVESCQEEDPVRVRFRASTIMSMARNVDAAMEKFYKSGCKMIRGDGADGALPQ